MPGLSQPMTRRAASPCNRWKTVAAARIRNGGQRAERTTGEIVAAMFRHEESRALDPQLHTHFVVFNATWDSVEKRWKALETSAMFDQIKLYTEVYRSELALRLQALGYALRHTDQRFRDCRRYDGHHRAVQQTPPGHPRGGGPADGQARETALE